MLVKLSDLAEFRSFHVSLWLAAALNIAAEFGSGDSLTSILGPDPKRYAQWLASMDADTVKHFEEVSALLAGGKKNITWFDVDGKFYHYHFALCKFVQLVEFLCYVKKSPDLE